MPRKTETPYEREQALNDKTDATIHCYTLGHSWDDFPGDEWEIHWTSLQFKPVSFRCTSCGTVRREFWDRRTGELCESPGRAYLYPADYRLDKDQLTSGRTRREISRAEYYNRRH